MHLLSYTLSLSVLAARSAIASVAFPLTERAIGQTCSTPDGDGTCQNTGDCTTQGFNEAGFCPGAADIQCCVKKTCSTGSGDGVCLNTSDKCGGSFVPGACPGSGTIQCCVAGAPSPAPSPEPSSSPPPPPSTSNKGASIVSAAISKEGLPYVWGGGGCAGPSSGGFDCSGLTQYATCQALDKTIPRTAQTQYHSDMGKRIPRSQAEAGDMIFWASGGDCEGGVAHVGIFVREGWMVNAAHTGTPVREQAIWESSGGESICPDAVRFW